MTFRRDAATLQERLTVHLEGGPAPPHARVNIVPNGTDGRPSEATRGAPRAQYLGKEVNVAGAIGRELEGVGRDGQGIYYEQQLESLYLYMHGFEQTDAIKILLA